MISKELLSEVLSLNKKVTFSVSTQHNRVVFDGDYNMNGSINIHELAHKCKDWAFGEGYELFSRILSNDHVPRGNCVVYRVEADPEESLVILNEKTEPEAIFKACEWVRENK